MEESKRETQQAALVNEDQAQIGEVTSAEQTKGVMKPKYFNALRIAYIAIFTALSLALRFAQFVVLPAVSFLKFDFSDVFILICAYALGPVSGMISAVIKEVLYGVIHGSSSNFVGELANILILVPFILLPSIMYKKHKGIKSVIFWLAISCVIRTLWSFPVNLLINFPAFTHFNWQAGMAMFWKFWYWVMLFNLLKAVMIAFVTLLLYKSISRLIHLINSKFIDERTNATVENTAEQ